VKFLIDNALSPDLADLLAAAGHDAVHVRTLGLQSAADALIFHTALEQQRVLVSADTDFGALLTLGQRDQPSVILLRHGSPRRPDQQAQMLLANLDNLAINLERGAIVVFRQNKIRIRQMSKKTGGGSAGNGCAHQRPLTMRAAVWCSACYASELVAGNPSHKHTARSTDAN
jgi:predicted nuclease of predicted toxin-antitoxin system